ncbi:hypothetical protein NHX12_004302 [Muraenolepis orangiensis]|uniref:Uncharacterized protein n=1 Tax=Muraenolepis orangiensis TaxID=630683 RepID=A0A9Q0DV37_9TELE|nr:hypothetical protein NHX12_004302 [Muraenolepis orangiensis]
MLQCKTVDAAMRTRRATEPPGVLEPSVKVLPMPQTKAIGGRPSIRPAPVPVVQPGCCETAGRRQAQQAQTRVKGESKEEA